MAPVTAQVITTLRLAAIDIPLEYVARNRPHDRRSHHLIDHLFSSEIACQAAFIRQSSPFSYFAVSGIGALKVTLNDYARKVTN